MRYLCLIPATRTSVAEAVSAAHADGWEVEVLTDPQGLGVASTREKLLRGLEGDLVVRYCDDDDLILPHRRQVLEFFQKNPSTDVIYTDYTVRSVRVDGLSFDISFTGDPVKDALRVHPWSWVARLEALHKVQRLQGCVWPTKYPRREGGYCWLGFLKSHLEIRYLPIQAYLYQAEKFPKKISVQGDFFECDSFFLKDLKDFCSLPR